MYLIIRANGTRFLARVSSDCDPDLDPTQCPAIDDALAQRIGTGELDLDTTSMNFGDSQPATPAEVQKMIILKQLAVLDKVVRRPEEDVLTFLSTKNGFTVNNGAGRNTGQGGAQGTITSTAVAMRRSRVLNNFNRSGRFFYSRFSKEGGDCMGWLSIVESIAIALGAIGVPIITALSRRQRAQENKRWQETSLLLRGMQRIGKLTYATALAYQRGKLATKDGKAVGFMIHSNGCEYVPAWHWPIRWNNANADCAVHFFADSFGLIQALPDTVQGWHAGGAANRDYLSVEQSEPYQDSPELFTPTTKNVRWLVETMQKKHGFTVNNVIGHYEGHLRGIASNHGDPKSDPGYIWDSVHAPWRDKTKNGQGYYTRNGYSMDQLRSDIRFDLIGQTPPPPSPPVQPQAPTQTSLPCLQLKNPYMTGAEVKLLQTKLKAAGCNPGPIDGIFGLRTDAAVRKYQTANHLTVDGIVGVVTWGMLLK